MMTYLGAVGILAVIYIFYALAKLSERLGSVEKMPLIYRYYYVAIFFLSISLIVRLLNSWSYSQADSPTGWLTASWFILIGYQLPLAVGVSLGMYVSWRYWSWLIASKNK